MTPWMRWMGCLGWALLSLGCRDEQAGPRPRVQAPPAPRLLDRAPTDLSFSSGVTLGGQTLTYLGSKLSTEKARPGQTVTVRHYFSALKPQPRGYQFFVHLVDASQLQMLGNADHDIQNGALPLGSWPAGKVVEDTHSFRMPDAPSGKVRLLLGFWKGQERLGVDSPEGADSSGRVLGPVIQVDVGDLPEYRVVRANPRPVIDGDLSDQAWRRAGVATLVTSFDGRPTRLKTQAQLLYDDEFLYVAFNAEDPDVWGTLTQRDDPIYTQEVVEVFLDADADGRTYNELQVSPNNVIFDAYFPARRQGMDLSFDSGMQTAVKVRGTVNRPEDEDQGWQVEMKIPFKRLHSSPKPKPGDRFRFNLYRLEHDRKQGREEGQAFSPLFIGDFHALPRFGGLVFAE